MTPDAILKGFEKLSPVRVDKLDHEKTGSHLAVTLEKSKIRDGATLLYESEFMVESVTAVDLKGEMMVVYHFAHTAAACRVICRVFLSKDELTVPTISDIFDGANWHERETRDFYGIMFDDHPDMTPIILCEEDVDFHPLLKEEKKLKAISDLLTEFAPPAEPEAEAGEETEG